jgi:hypothetical protein
VACVRDDEVELVRAGEVSDAGVADAGGLVCRDDVVPLAHLRRRRRRRRERGEEGSWQSFSVLSSLCAISFFDRGYGGLRPA